MAVVMLMVVLVLGVFFFSTGDSQVSIPTLMVERSGSGCASTILLISILLSLMVVFLNA